MKLKKIRFMIILNISLFIVISLLYGQNKPKNREVILLNHSIWQVYGGNEELTIKSIEEDDKVKGRLTVRLQANKKTFSHFLISKDGAESWKDVDGVLLVDFNLDNPQMKTISFKIKLVSSGGESSRPYTIELEGTSSKYWSSRGAMGYPNWITVKTKPYINFASTYEVEDWVYKKPNRDEIDFAKTKWGNLVDNNKSDYENARTIAVALLKDLSGHVGTPSDSMYSEPFEQYQRMVSSKDKGFCSNFAHIFIHACNSFGIPARRIHLQKIYSKTDDPQKLSVRMGGMHSTVEIFDDELNQWILMDYYSRSLGFFLGKEGPLNAVEFGLFLNEVHRRENLMMDYYDPKFHQIKRIHISDNPKTVYGSFDGKDTEFHFFIKK